MRPLSQKKVSHTSFVIVPPPDLWNQIQSFRKFYDPAYERWMPHINICWPFVEENDFDIAYELLQDEFKDFEPFELSFNTIGHFEHSKIWPLWLKPETFNGELNKIEEKILKILPFCNDLLQNHKEGFQGHLTIGKFDEKIIDKKKTEFLSKWKPIKFMVNELYMIFRKDAVSPFFVIKTIKFKNFDEKNSYKDEINKCMKEFETEFYQTNVF